MGKIKLEYDDETGAWYEDESVDIAVEVPDAIIADFRETRARLLQLHDYFTEKVQPQIDAEYARRREEWRRTHPEQTKEDDAFRDIYLKAIYDQAMAWPPLFGNLPNYENVLLAEPAEIVTDRIVYDLIPPDKKDDE